MMGCGIQYIWDHYGQIDVEKMAKDATKKVSYDKEGNIVIKYMDGYGWTILVFVCGLIVGCALGQS